ncbi:MAG TPA: retropepsin-like aspartic protease [Gemmatimonadaceae bacterium]|nr:retropepsin-like aspartic protease [Gemmatimonadaceae bacterium]
MRSTVSVTAVLAFPGYNLPRRVCAAAALTVLLEGCFETAGVLSLADAQRNFVAPVPSSRAIDPGSSGDYSDAFWNAVADLDLSTSRQVARTGSERRFVDGVAALIAGDERMAEMAFSEMVTERSDPTVAAAAQLMFAATLLYEHKWSALSEFTEATQRGDADLPGVSGMEKWGKAFAGLDPQVISFPRREVTLPLRVTPVGTPTVRVRINGKDYQFWLDTGSSMTVLSSDVAADAHVSVLTKDTLTVATFAGVAPARPALLPRMELGSVAITNSPAIVIDSRLMRIHGTAEGVPLSGLPVDGIIGWDVIRQLDILLDYASGKATVREPRYLGTIGTSMQNLKWVGKPFILLRTKSGATLHLTLDTGAQASFLNGAILKKAQVTATNSNARAYGIARTGGKPAQAVPSLSVDVGGTSIVLRDLIVYNPTSSSLINCDGILGSDIAQFGAIRIDATNGLFSVG